MADNIAVTAGTGTTIAADDIGGGILAQRVKPVWGPDGTGNDVDIAAGKPLPVQIRSATGLIPLGEPTDPKSTATDATSTGMIALTKQLSASLQLIAAPGLNARNSVIRPSDTNIYAARDVVGVTGGGTACMTFALGAVSGGNIMLTAARLQRNATAVISGETTYELHFYNVTQPGAQVDNASFDVAAGDQASYLGYITFPALSDLGSTLHSNLENIGKQMKLASGSLFGVLVTVGTYTPASAAVHVVDISAIQL